MPIAPGISTDAPPRTPPANGLLNSATVVPHDDVDWINGIKYSPENCGNATGFDPCTPSADGYTRNRTTSLHIVPFGVQAFDECSAFGFQKADYEARARRALLASESKAVESEFWTGTIQPVNGVHLQDATRATVLLSGAAQTLRAGLDALVQAVADLNLGAGMIHARPGLVNAWASLNVLRWANNKLYTLTGTIVVPEAGATGAAPDGTAATSTAQWAYVTDPVQVHQQAQMEVFVPEANYGQNLDRTNNLITVRAARMNAVVGNFCAVGAVKINPTS